MAFQGLLTLLHLESPKLNRVLAVLSAIGLKGKRVYVKLCVYMK